MIKAGFILAVKARLFLDITLDCACLLADRYTDTSCLQPAFLSPANGDSHSPSGDSLSYDYTQRESLDNAYYLAGELAPLDFDSPFFSALPETEWQPPARSAADMTLPVEWDQVENPQVVAGLSNTQRNLLRQNGFLVLHTQEPDFNHIRQLASSETGQPYYLSTDAAYHALRQELAHLIPL